MRLAERRRRPALRKLGVDVAAALHVVGSLLRPLGIAYVVPAAVAVGHGEPPWAFLAGGAGTSGCGLVLIRATRGARSAGAREGYLIVALLWFLVAGFGTIPYLAEASQ